jgi:hypothetical protein
MTVDIEISPPLNAFNNYLSTASNVFTLFQNPFDSYSLSLLPGGIIRVVGQYSQDLLTSNL